MKKGDKVMLTGNIWLPRLKGTIQTIEGFNDDGVPYFLDDEAIFGRWYIIREWTAKVVKKSWIKRLLGLL